MTDLILKSSFSKNSHSAFSLMAALVSVLMSSACGRSVQESQSADEMSQTSSTQRPASAARSAVVLGDSQSTGGYGQRLGELIRHSSQQKLVYFGAASSARVGSWVSGGFTPIPSNAYFGCTSGGVDRSCSPTMQPGKRTESIASIIRTVPTADLYILTFGDNHFFDPASIRADLPRLVKPILNAGARCVFVTPTEGVGRFADKRLLMNNIKRTIDEMRNSIGGTCTLIDSYSVGKDVLKTDADLQLMRRSVSQDPMGLHPQGSGARLWGERVFAALSQLGLLSKL